MQWTEKKLQRQAETLFELACDVRCYKATKLPVQKTKTPDFLVRTARGEFMAEVKSPGLDPQLKSAMGGSQKIFSSTIGNRVRVAAGVTASAPLSPERIGSSWPFHRCPARQSSSSPSPHWIQG